MYHHLGTYHNCRITEFKSHMETILLFVLQVRKLRYRVVTRFARDPTLIHCGATTGTQAR